MGRILKLLGIVGGAVLAIFIVALVAVSLFFDPNDYKVEISTAVEQATGRQLSLDGDLELDIFPRLRVAIGAAELSSAAGFGDAPFATIQGAGLAVGLLPLLSRRVEIGEARLEGLVLNLARNEQGQNNWQELGGTAAPESTSSTADSASLELDVGASVSAELVYDANRMMLEDVEFVLDDSQLTGELGLLGDSIRFDLDIDTINIDRYLPPATEGAAAEEGSLDEVDLPLEVLRTLRAAGQIAINETQFAGRSLSKVEFSFSAEDGLVSLEPSASLYSGTYAGEITVRVTDDTAMLSIDQQLTGIEAMPLGRDLMDVESLSGTLNASMSLAASGSNLGEVRRQLAGDINFALTDGAWEGFDMWFELRRARAAFGSRPMPARAGPVRTAFSEMSASGVLEDSVMTNRDLTADLELMTVTGGGTVNIVTDAIDFDVIARFVDGTVLQSDPEIVDLAGDELPLTISGSLSSPSVLSDFSAMLSAEAEEALQEEIEEEREELQDRLEDRLRGLFDR